MTRVSRFVAAPPAAVYAALLDPDSVQRWRVPDDMKSEVHRLEPREGGELRVSLTYLDPDRRGKTSGRTDTYRGRFLQLVPGKLVVEEIEFETDDPALRGVMKITTELTAAASGVGTEVTMLHEGLPDAVSRSDNELGTRMALDKLARLLEEE